MGARRGVVTGRSTAFGGGGSGDEQAKSNAAAAAADPLVLFINREP
jgi:hypothetical protein